MARNEMTTERSARLEVGTSKIAAAQLNNEWLSELAKTRCTPSCHRKILTWNDKKISTGKKKELSMPEDRIELSTPGLLDQCSSH